jgi:hypothetical protein
VKPFGDNQAPSEGPSGNLRTVAVLGHSALRPMGPALQGDDAYVPLPKSPLGVDVLAGTLAQSPARLSAVMVTMSASSVTPAVCAKAW